MVPLFKARPPATELRRLSELLGASSCIASVVTCPVPLSSCAELEAELATEAGTGGRDDGQMWFGSVFFFDGSYDLDCFVFEFGKFFFVVWRKFLLIVGRF